MVGLIFPHAGGRSALTSRKGEDRSGSEGAGSGSVSAGEGRHEEQRAGCSFDTGAAGGVTAGVQVVGPANHAVAHLVGGVERTPAPGTANAGRPRRSWWTLAPASLGLTKLNEPPSSS